MFLSTSLLVRDSKEGAAAYPASLEGTSIFRDILDRVLKKTFCNPAIDQSAFFHFPICNALNLNPCVHGGV